MKSLCVYTNIAAMSITRVKEKKIGSFELILSYEPKDH